eukprot:TRINITY_DN5719_c0_g1_i1.p1 TRINITY_DN5719_c0_g1~~TRINITY_DN5719_c0_g1_i1.p1  ORF type:complete len:353 (-),score=72.60 TRINITY_DN5719_c0_g1_i1:119-1177(-)
MAEQWPQSFVGEALQFVICLLAGFAVAWVFGLVELPSKRNGAKLEGVEGVEDVGISRDRGCRGRVAKRESVTSAKRDNRPSSKLRVPEELVSQVSRWLNLKDISALTTANVGFQRQFWQAADVWAQLAVDRRLPARPLRAAESEPGGASARESFRRSLFRLAGYRLHALAGGGGDVGSALRNGGADVSSNSEGQSSSFPLGGSWNYAEVLTEATHMMSGIMPRDGPEVIEDLYVVAEMSLQGHDSADGASAAAADRFLRAARERRDIFDEDQLERLDLACEGAIHFDKLMERTMREFYEGLPQVQAEMQGFYAPDSRNEAESVSETASKHLRAEYEAMHEAEYETFFREQLS